MATKPHRSAAAKTIKPKAAPHGPSEAQDKPAKGKTAAAAKPPAKKTSKTTKPAAPRKPGGAAVSKAGLAQSAERRSPKPKAGGSIPSPVATHPKTGGSAPLNPRQRAFVAEYLKDHNATEAYIRAYGASRTTADTAGPRLFGDVRVKAQIVRHQTAVIEQVKAETGITLERTLREIARVAFFDVRKLFKANGEPLPLTELDDDTAAAIAGLDVLEAFEGAGEDRRKVGDIKKWKLADKLGGLDKLMKHLDGYNADNKGKGDSLAEALAGFVSQIHQSGAGRVKFVPRAKP